MNSKVKKMCINAMGIALFVVLSYLLKFPIFENFYLCLGYVVMTVYLYSFGIFSGTIVGVLGTLIYCILISGLRGMPGWILGNIVIGIILGLYFKYFKNLSKDKYIIFLIYSTIVIVISVGIGILGIKSITECILYSQPFLIRLTTNFSAFIADVLVIVLSIPFCRLLDKHIKKFI